MAGFIKKNWQKDSTDVLIKSGIRAAGGLSAAFLATKGPFKARPKDEAQTLHNIGGPLLLAAGVLGDMMLDDPKLRAFCQGVSTYAALHSIAVISPGETGLAAKIGIEGLNGADDVEDAALMSGIGALGTTSTATEDVNAIKALAAGAQTQNDGNDWAYVAKNVDYANQITKPAVSGVASEAAALMGTDNEEEAALLMGMF